MISREEARERVQRGAAHLDTVRPGWFNRIDDGTLTLWDGCRCTLGQVFGEYRSGLAICGWHPYFDGVPVDAPQALHGFTIEGRDIPPSDGSWIVLQDAWISAIADRRLSQEVNTPRTDVAVPVSA